jgi:acyl-CoA reductase-like NAD-dependent aldehyde dehydrogenase/nicotinamidase-related amidase
MCFRNACLPQKLPDVKSALLTVDLQQDYLARPGLSPPVSILTGRAAELIGGCRSLSIPILHIRTIIHRDGTNRMPHWKRSDHWACVEGTEGVEAPKELAPMPSEPIVSKPFYSAFGNPQTNRILGEWGIEQVIIAGVYSHACVRATILDAYQAGYEVWVAEDAIATNEPLHGDLTRRYLDGRICQFMASAEILRRLGLPKADRSPDPGVESLPVGCVANGWVTRKDQHLWVRRNPSDWDEVITTVPIGQEQDIDLAVSAAAECHASWSRLRVNDRVDLLRAWSTELGRRASEITALLALEIGKPLLHGMAEFRYAMDLLDATIGRANASGEEQCGPGIRMRRCPLGVVGLISPWNNPLAIPLGKLAPAVANGNCVVWKPAPEAPRLAMLIMETLIRAGLPPGCVNLIQGNASTAQYMLTHPAISAVSITGRTESGRLAAGMCAAHGKALQAELGGNNAALVMAGCEIETVATELAFAAFRFSGQSCTAPRRLIVEKNIRRQFEAALVRAVSGLRIGAPQDRETAIGPLISKAHVERIRATVESAVLDGGRVLLGGKVPKAYGHGCWHEPTVVADLPQNAYAVQEESFGPLVVLLDASDIEEAITICNGVRQGLVATLYSSSQMQKEQFLAKAQAGILRINRGAAGVSADAPFGGWKASGIGLPEHGYGDQEFYTRPQAIYEG